MLLNKNKHKFKKQPRSKPAKEFWFPLSYHCPGRSSPRGFKAISSPWSLGGWTVSAVGSDLCELTCVTCVTCEHLQRPLVASTHRAVSDEQGGAVCRGLPGQLGSLCLLTHPYGTSGPNSQDYYVLEFSQSCLVNIFLTQINSLIRKVFFVSTTLRVHIGTTWVGFVGFLFFALNDHWLFEYKWPSINFFCFYAAIPGISQQFNNE